MAARQAMAVLEQLQDNLERLYTEGSPASAGVASPQLTHRLSADRPLLSEVEYAFPAESAGPLLEKACALAQASFPALESGFAVLAGDLDQLAKVWRVVLGPGSHPRLPDVLAAIDPGLPVPGPLAEVVMVAVVRAFLRPLALHYAAEAAELEVMYCPVCGLAPFLSALLPETGKRMCECTLCTAQWNVPRVRCLHCSAGGEARYLYVDDRPEHRAYVCDRCRTYTKCVDWRAGGQQGSLRLTDAPTLYVDIAAWRDGYRPGGYAAYGSILQSELGGMH